MADTAAAQVQAPAPDAAAPPPARPGPDRGAVRAARRMAAMAHVQSAGAAAAPAETAAPVAKPAAAAPVAEPAKPAEAAVEKPDPATDRGLRAIEQAKKKAFDEVGAAKAELDVQRAEIARLRKEAEGKISSIDELTKLSPVELLERLDHWTEDDFDIASRASYARTKAGKVDPRAQTAAQEATRAQGGRKLEAELKAAHAELSELREFVKGEFTRRDQVAFAQTWLEGAVKSIPADKPTFLSKLHANEPETARREIFLLGQELEKANDGVAPTHAEVVAEFENRKRASLKALGLDPDALLAPPKPAPATKAPARTLDPTAPNLTRPSDAPKTRDERRAVALANIAASKRTTADQT